MNKKLNTLLSIYHTEDYGMSLEFHASKDKSPYENQTMC